MSAPHDRCARRERRDAQKNMERVLAAARVLFAKRGPEHVRMEDVASEAGVGVGTIYRRFRSKEELFAAVSEAACADTHATLHAAVRDSNADPIGKLRALIIVQYRRSATFAMLIEPNQAGNTGMCGVFDQQELYSALHTMLIEIIGEGQRHGLIRSGNTALLAALCLELINPRTAQHLAHAAEYEVEDLAHDVADFAIRALRI
jgi:AcrR family transcriptional regulator